MRLIRIFRNINLKGVFNMAKKIRLIDNVAADVEVAPTEEGQVDNVASAFTKNDIATLMKLAEAIDWKLWELLKFARKLEEDQD
jgi:hypothetical protein